MIKLYTWLKDRWTSETSAWMKKLQRLALWVSGAAAGIISMKAGMGELGFNLPFIPEMPLEMENFLQWAFWVAASFAFLVQFTGKKK